MNAWAAESTPQRQARAAMTLTEIIMATVILAVVTVAILEGMSATTRFAAMTEKQDDLAIEAKRIVATISQDLSHSGWELPSFTSDVYRTRVTTTFANDRQLIYYPYVLQQSPDLVAGLASEGLPAMTAGMAASFVGDELADASFAHAVRERELVDLDLRLPVPGQREDFRKHFSSDADLTDAERQERYVRSYHARSQELIFLKSSAGDWQPTPDAQQAPILFFGGATSDWSPPEASVAGMAAKELAFLNKRADLLAAGSSADEATDGAHQYVQNTFYAHDRIGVLRMSEFDLHGTVSTAANGFDYIVPSPRVRSGAGIPPQAQAIDNLIADGAWLQVDASDQVNVRVRWETRVEPGALNLVDDPDSPAERINQGQLREYLYAVVPSPQGVGRLLRAYSIALDDVNGDGVTGDAWSGDSGIDPGQLLSSSSTIQRGFVVDRVLSDNVARILFDTYRTVDDDSLGLNEVRLRLYLAATHNEQSDHTDSHVVRLQVDQTFTMRTGNNDRENQRNLQLLGDRGVAFSY